MEIVGLAGFAGVVLFGLLYVVFFFRGTSLKLPVIGMACFALVTAAAAVVPRLGLSLPEFLEFSEFPDLPFPGGGPSPTEQAEVPDEEVPATPGADGFPQLLLDRRGVAITATGLDKTGAQGPALKLSIENRSETNVTVEVRDACINGWMMDASCSVSVDAGGRKEGTVLFLSSRIRRSGIESIAEMELFFHILNQDRITFLEPDGVIARVPNAGGWQASFDGLGEELYHENGLRVVSGGFSPEEPGLVLFIENTTDRTLTVQARDILVNGKAADAVFSEDVLPGRRSAAALTLPDISPEDVRKISFSLRVRDRGQRTILFDTEPFTVVV